MQSVLLRESLLLRRWRGEPSTVEEAWLPRNQRWARLGTGWLPLSVLYSLLEFLHQVLATDFQFAKQNKFALIGKIHRKDCLDFNAAAGSLLDSKFAGGSVNPDAIRGLLSLL